MKLLYPALVSTFQMFVTMYFTVYPINVLLLRMSQKKKKKIEGRSTRLQQAQSQHLLENDTVGCESSMCPENGQRVGDDVPKNKTKRSEGLETDQLQQLYTTLVRIIESGCVQPIERNRFIYLYISLQLWRVVLQAALILRLIPAAGDSGRWNSEL